jgi:vancomycin resistance protein YoaR
MKFLKLFTMTLGILVLLCACETTKPAKKAVKAKESKPILCSRCKAKIKSSKMKPRSRKSRLARSKDRKIKRKAAFKARMAKLNKTDPKRYAAEMKRRNEYKALQELRKKDPKAYKAKMAEIRKKRMAEQEARFMKQMEKIKKTDPKRYATEMKRYNEYKALQELRKKDPKAYQVKMKEIRKKRMAEYKATMAKEKNIKTAKTTAK